MVLQKIRGVQDVDAEFDDIKVTPPHLATYSGIRNVTSLISYTLFILYSGTYLSTLLYLLPAFCLLPRLLSLICYLATLN